MPTFCPPTAQAPKAGNILKTKGRNRAFFAAKAGNILKQSNLQKSARTRKTHDKVPDTKYAKGWAQGAPQSYESGKEPIYLSHSGSLWAVVFSSPEGAPQPSPGQRSCERIMKQTSHHRDTEALRTERKEPSNDAIGTVRLKARGAGDVL